VSELSKIASTIGGLQNIGSITSNISGLVSSFNTLSSALSSRNIATTAKAFVKGALKRTITNVMKKIPKISFKF